MISRRISYGRTALVTLIMLAAIYAAIIVTAPSVGASSPIGCHDCYVATATTAQGYVYAAARGDDACAIDAALALVPTVAFRGLVTVTVEYQA